MIVRYPERIKRFLLVGFSAFLVNTALTILLVEILEFVSSLQKNIANFIAMEISIFYNFISRMWTWKDAPKKTHQNLVIQFFAFNFAALAGVLIRIVSFALLESWRVYYFLNMTIGIGATAMFDFFLYDKLIFGRVAHEKKEI